MRSLKKIKLKFPTKQSSVCDLRSNCAVRKRKSKKRLLDKSCGINQSVIRKINKSINGQ